VGNVDFEVLEALVQVAPKVRIGLGAEEGDHFVDARTLFGGPSQLLAGVSVAAAHEAELRWRPFARPR
jgi:hypothetical protein